MTTQDTRKDPRAKVLTMTVRYKSATLDEFIEHHSYDVSRGGMFIKTPSPFPPGTLLKFEVKIASEQRVMQGVGRVVWKREAAEANESRPAGMGVKFIKIDDESRKVIDQLIDARGDNASNYEAGEADAPPPAPLPPRPDVASTSAPPSGAARNNPNRKSTMIGLGAMATPSESPPKETASSSFFPESNFEQPAPEDRTVMKQAAELLEDALREAGGSLEDVGTPAAPSTSSAKVAPPTALPAPAPVSSEASLPKVVITEAPDTSERSKPESPSARLVLEPRADSARARMAVTQPASPKPVPVPVPLAAPAKAVGSSAVPPVKVDTARSRSAAMQEAAGVAADGGGGGAKTMLVVVAAAAAAVIVYFATRAPEPAPEPPSMPAAEAPSPEPTPANAPPAPEAPPSEVAAEPAAKAAASAATPTPASAAPGQPALREPMPPAPLPRPEPAPKATPAPKPAAATRPKPTEPSVQAPEPAQPAPPKAEAPRPAPKPVKPKVTPAPRPAPTPKPAVGDNPY